MLKRLKIVLVALSLVSFFIETKAQNVGINTTGALPDVSSMLDVVSTTKGFLIPRMTTVQKNAVATPATGLLVFDTTVGAFYYYTGTVWTPLLDSNLGWELDGNTTTIPGTDYIGTTDAQDLVFKTAGVERMRIDAANNYLGIGTTTPGSGVDVHGITASTASVDINRYSVNQFSGYLDFRKSRGVAVGVNTAVQTGDRLLTFRAHANDGTATWINSVDIYAAVAAAPSGGFAKTYFKIRLDDGTGLKGRLKIAETGVFTFNDGPELVGSTYNFTPITTGASEFNFPSYNADAISGSKLFLYYGRGTPAAHTAALSGDELGKLGFGGYVTATTVTTSSYLSAFATENFTGTNSGSDLRFYTTANAAGVVTERMRIGQDGVITYTISNNDVVIDATGNTANESNIHPKLAGTGTFGYGNIGNATYFTDYVYSDNIRYRSILTFDTYDDIELINNIKTKTYWDPYLKHHIMVMDPKSLPLCVTNYKERLEGKTENIFVDAGNMTGLLIGVSKQINKESKERDQRLNDRTELLAKAVGVSFTNKDGIRYRDVSKMGQGSVDKQEVLVKFNSVFSQKPIVTIASNTVGKNLYVINVTMEGFVVVTDAKGSVDFSWIAMGKEELVNDRYDKHIENVFYRKNSVVEGDFPMYEEKLDKEVVDDVIGYKTAIKEESEVRKEELIREK